MLNNFIKFERKFYGILDIRFGRPIKVKAIVYFFLLLGLSFLFSNMPVLKNIVNKIPGSIRYVIIPGALAWLLADVGTEDRSPVRFFRSFIIHHFKRFVGNTVYRGNALAKRENYIFEGYVETQEVSTVKEALKFMSQKEKVTKNSSDKYVERLNYISEKNKENNLKNEGNLQNNFNDFSSFGESLFAKNDSPKKADDVPPLIKKNKVQYPYKENDNEESIKVVDENKDVEKHKIKDKRTFKKKRFISKPVLTFVLVFIVGAFFVLASTGAFSANVKDKDDEITQENANLELALEKYDEAVKYFANIDFNELEQKEQEFVLLYHLFTGDAKNALRLDSNFDKVVIAYYETIKKENELRSLVNMSDNIAFKVALIDENYEKIIDLVDDIDIKTLEEKELKEIMKAYFSLDMEDEAIEFAEKHNSDKLLNLINDYEENKEKEGKKKNKNKKKSKKKKDNKKKKKSKKKKNKKKKS